MHGDDGTEVDHQNIAELVERNTFFSHKVFRCFFSEIGPADQCRDGKGRQGDGQEGVTHIGKVPEGCGREAGFRHAGRGGRIVEHIGYDDDAGDQAHDYRVPEYGGHGDISLDAGLGNMGCGGRDGGGADACLVGKKASGDAVAQGVLDGCARHAAGHGAERKGVSQDQQAGGRQYFVIEQQKQQAAEEIDEADRRHHAFADVGDALYAAEDHGPGEEGEDDPYQMGRQMEGFRGRLGDGIGLGGAADAEGGDQRAGSVNTAQIFVM